MAGRPRKTWDADQVELFTKLCGIMCTRDEVCAVMEIDPKQLTRRIEENFPDTPTWGEAFERFSGAGKASLRRAQFQQALDGSIPMLIFLGKNYLGQSDSGAKQEEQKPSAETRITAFQSRSKFSKAANG